MGVNLGSEVHDAFDIFPSFSRQPHHEIQLERLYPAANQPLGRPQNLGLGQVLVNDPAHSFRARFRRHSDRTIVLRAQRARELLSDDVGFERRR